MKYMYDDSNLELDDEITLQKKEKDFYERCNLYSQLFSTYKDLFPKRFLKEYNKNNFHDYYIESINIIHKKNHFDLSLLISDGENTFEILYCDVKAVKTDFTGYGFVDIVYNEILQTEDGLFSHEFELGFGEGLLYIIFKYLRFKKVIKT